MTVVNKDLNQSINRSCSKILTCAVNVLSASHIALVVVEGVQYLQQGVCFFREEHGFFCLNQGKGRRATNDVQSTTNLLIRERGFVLYSVYINTGENDGAFFYGPNPNPVLSLTKRKTTAASILPISC